LKRSYHPVISLTKASDFGAQAQNLSKENNNDDDTEG
jgi:hypothetical protein